jgi:hypothetical protein
MAASVVAFLLALIYILFNDGGAAVGEYYANPT